VFIHDFTSKGFQQNSVLILAQSCPSVMGKFHEKKQEATEATILSENAVSHSLSF